MQKRQRKQSVIVEILVKRNIKLLGYEVKQLYVSSNQ